MKLASGNKGGAEEVTMRELGISYPVLVKPLRPVTVELPLPTAQTGSGSRSAEEAKPASAGAVDASHTAAAAHDEGPRTVTVQKFDFDVQFCWQPKTPTERHEAKKPKEQNAGPVAQQ